jgi:hypothetical protein
MNLSSRLFISIVATTAILPNFIFATPKKACKKIYVNSNQIKASKDGILIQTARKMFRIKCLRSDEKGIYFFKKDFETLIDQSQQSRETTSNRDKIHFKGDQPSDSSNNSGNNRGEKHEHSWIDDFFDPANDYRSPFDWR